MARRLERQRVDGYRGYRARGERLLAGVDGAIGSRRLKVVDGWKGEKATKGRRAEKVDGVEGQKGGIWAERVDG